MIREVLHHITHHLDEEISLEKLAQLSGYSPFHLHRKIREELKEPVGNFIKRQRMETAAYMLALTAVPVSQIKFLVGYNNDSAFSRAFREIMHASPRAYRADNQYKSSVNAMEGYLSLTAKKVRIIEQTALLFPSLGNYFSTEIYKVWKDVEDYLQAGGLNKDDFEYYSVMHSCQNVNPGLNRYDAAIVPKPGVKLEKNRFFQSQLPGGNFACYTFCCPVAEYRNTSLQIGRHFFEQSIYQHREGVSYFKFHTLPNHENPDNQLIDWLVPIQ
jgi:AraC family transcriptional regulator